MKKVLIFIAIYIIISLVELAIGAIPTKAEQEKHNEYMQNREIKEREFVEEQLPDLPEEMKETVVQERVNRYKGYEPKDTFFKRFTNKLKMRGLALIIVIVGLTLSGLRHKELHR